MFRSGRANLARKRIIVATDHEDVARAVEAAGGEVCMTRADHQSGTERLAGSGGRSADSATIPLL